MRTAAPRVLVWLVTSPVLTASPRMADMAADITRVDSRRRSSYADVAADIICADCCSSCAGVAADINCADCCFDAFSSPRQSGTFLIRPMFTILLFIPQSRETTLRAEPCRIIFTEYDSTLGDRISALDEELNNFMIFLETEFNKEEESIIKPFS